MKILSWPALVILGLTVQTSLAQETQPASLEGIIIQLQSDDVRIRLKAFDALEKLQEKPMSIDEASRAIKASIEKFPVEKTTFHTPGAALIKAAVAVPRAQLLPELQRIFDQMPPDAKAATIESLPSFKSEEAMKWFIEAFLKNVDTLPWSDDLEMRFQNGIGDPDMRRVILEALKHEKTTLHAVECLLYCAEKKKLPNDFLSNNLESIIEAYRPWLKKCDPVAAKAISKPPEDYRWQTPYDQNLAVAEYFPDLFGHVKGSEGILRDSLDLKVPRISAFAIRSLLMLGGEVPQEHVDFVAADDEMRNLLYSSLNEHHQEKLFPKAYLNQEAFARSEMFSWLIYPTELGRAPAVIELMKVVDVDLQNPKEIVSIYLFRFKKVAALDEKESKWKAGIAGGYRKSEMPTTESLGHTFSSFKDYDSLAPEQHVAETIASIEKAWRERSLGK